MPRQLELSHSCCQLRQAPCLSKLPRRPCPRIAYSVGRVMQSKREERIARARIWAASKQSKAELDLRRGSPPKRPQLLAIPRTCATKLTCPFLITEYATHMYAVSLFPTIHRLMCTLLSSTRSMFHLPTSTPSHTPSTSPQAPQIHWSE